MQYKTQPKKEFKDTMDYKAEQIKKFSDDRQEGMRLMSSGRDATLMTTNMLPKSEEEAKEKILMWRKWFYVNIYGHNEEFYKQNNNPF